MAFIPHANVKPASWPATLAKQNSSKADNQPAHFTPALNERVPPRGGAAWDESPAHVGAPVAFQVGARAGKMDLKEHQLSGAHRQAVRAAAVRRAG